MQNTAIYFWTFFICLKQRSYSTILHGLNILFKNNYSVFSSSSVSSASKSSWSWASSTDCTGAASIWLKKKKWLSNTCVNFNGILPDSSLCSFQKGAWSLCCFLNANFSNLHHLRLLPFHYPNLGKCQNTTINVILSNIPSQSCNYLH